MSFLNVEPWTRYFAWWPTRCVECDELFCLGWGYYRLLVNVDAECEYKCEECY